MSACPDTKDNPVPPLAIGKVSEVIAVAENEARLNVPNETTDKMSPALAPEFSVIVEPSVAV